MGKDFINKKTEEGDYGRCSRDGRGKSALSTCLKRVVFHTWLCCHCCCCRCSFLSPFFFLVFDCKVLWSKAAGYGAIEMLFISYCQGSLERSKRNHSPDHSSTSKTFSLFL